MKRLALALALILAAGSARAAPTARTLTQEWRAAHEACRGGAGDDPKTDQACDRRSNLEDALKRRGMCYRGDWVRCRRG